MEKTIEIANKNVFKLFLRMNIFGSCRHKAKIHHYEMKMNIQFKNKIKESDNEGKTLEKE